VRRKELERVGMGILCFTRGGQAADTSFGGGSARPDAPLGVRRRACGIPPSVRARDTPSIDPRGRLDEFSSKSPQIFPDRPRRHPAPHPPSAETFEPAQSPFPTGRYDPS
jgi:hypothetical protein